MQEKREKKRYAGRATGGTPPKQQNKRGRTNKGGHRRTKPPEVLATEGKQPKYTNPKACTKKERDMAREERADTSAGGLWSGQGSGIYKWGWLWARVVKTEHAPQA